MLDSSQIESIEKRVHNILACSQFKALIADTKLLKEQPIVYKEHFYQLDLLASGSDKNIVFDYKSSRKFEVKHREQVQNYVEALQSMDSKEVKGYIIYLLEEGVELVEI
jgi:exodeoxyribonuclease V beta subunit